MKILGNFNTTLDQDVIHEKSFIIKVHPIILLSFKNILLYILFFLTLGGFLYFQIKFTGNDIGFILSGVYLLLIFYLFYNQGKFYYYYVKHFKLLYGLKEKQILIKQDIIYDRTLKTSLFLLFLNVLISFITIAFIIYSSSAINYLSFGIFLIVNIFLIMLQWGIIKRTLINLEMDFTVVDGDLLKVDQINQTGFLNIGYNSATFDLISSVDGSSSGFLESWLHYGTLSIVTLGNTPNIRIPYVKKPNTIASLILRAKNLSQQKSTQVQKAKVELEKK